MSYVVVATDEDIREWKRQLAKTERKCERLRLRIEQAEMFRPRPIYTLKDLPLEEKEDEC